MHYFENIWYFNHRYHRDVLQELVDLCLTRMLSYQNSFTESSLITNMHPSSDRSVSAINFIKESDIFRISDKAIRDNLESLATCEVDEAHVRSELTALVPMIAKWIDVITTTGILIKHEMISIQSSDQCNIGCIFFVLDSMYDVEETVWSPVSGVKGQIDMVVKGRIEFRIYPNNMISHINALVESPLNISPALRSSLLYSETLYLTVVPLELKTGKWKPQSLLGHRAQTMLYLLMLWLRERNCNQSDYELPKFGLLCYMSTDSCRCEVVTTSWADIKGLIVTRNKISAHLKQNTDSSLRSLPNMLRSEVNCESCFQAAECMIYHAAIESGDSISCGTPDLFVHSLRGFTSSEHIEYFKHWDHLLNLEAATSISNQHLMWTMSGTLREISGGCCIANLKISNFSTLLSTDPGITSPVELSGIDIETFEPVREYTLELKRFIEKESETKDIQLNNSYSGILQSKRWNFDLGDQVFVSLERNVEVTPDNTTGSNGLDTYTEPNICSGTISFLDCSIDSGIVCRLTLKKIPYRLLGYHSEY